MSGILFLRTRARDRLRAFYRDTLGMDLWLEQAECTLLKSGNLLLGFCDGETAETAGLITFFYAGRQGVDDAYRKMKSTARKAPAENERYNIYHFFAEDPEGRPLEFQAFLHPLEPHLDGEALLTTRRSVRAFKNDLPAPQVLDRLFETCRYAPTSMHSQSYDFVAVKNRRILDELASLRGNSSAPLARAPMAVAVCGDPARSGAHVQDACIAAYHFLLAAWAFGLGTCWIGAMDRIEVKETLGIPKERYVATVTPLGTPDEEPGAKERRDVDQMVRWVD